MNEYAYLAAVISLAVTVFAAWVTHILACIKTAAWFLMLFGIIVPPIGIVHGVAVWFGWV